MRLLLNKNQYEKTVRRPYPPFMWSLMFGGIGSPALNRPFLDKAIAIENESCVEGIVYYDRNEKARYGQTTLTQWLNKKRFVNAVKLLRKREAELIFAAQKDFNAFCNSFEIFSPAVSLVYCIDPFIESYIKNLLYKKLPAKQAQKIMDALNTPLEDNFYKKEECDLVKTKDIKEHIKEYGWLLSRYGNYQPYTFAQAKAKLSVINKQKLLLKRRLEKERLRRTIAHTKKLLGAKGAHVVDIMQFVVFYRTQRTDILNKSTFIAHRVLVDFAKQKGLSYQQLMHCTRKELETGKFSLAVINARLINNSVIMRNGKVTVLSGKESKTNLKHLEEAVTNQENIHGVVASPGKALGKVKLVFAREDFGKVKSGDILVTSMTTPEMVPIMKKAAAFITDEGGITCHAAIMSRELKKPCIIGTKIATKIFKDGDIIEVDANKGIVKKLK